MRARTSGSQLTGIRPEGPRKHSPGFSLGLDLNPMCALKGRKIIQHVPFFRPYRAIARGVEFTQAKAWANRRPIDDHGIDPALFPACTHFDRRTQECWI
jgi:hypothetical protein